LLALYGDCRNSRIQYLEGVIFEEETMKAASRMFKRRSVLKRILAVILSVPILSSFIKGANAMTEKTESTDPDLGAIFDTHVKHEFVDKDVDATMDTMTEDPYVHHVAMATGGVGRQGVRDFYKNYFVGKWPADVKVIRISRTVGKDVVIDELVVTFTHDVQLDFMLPGIKPTGKKVELPHVIIMKFENGKVAHEHIYWDQGSLLAQVGLLDHSKVPVLGVEQTRKLLELVSRKKEE